MLRRLMETLTECADSNSPASCSICSYFNVALQLCLMVTFPLFPLFLPLFATALTVQLSQLCLLCKLFFYIYVACLHWGPGTP